MSRVGKGIGEQVLSDIAIGIKIVTILLIGSLAILIIVSFKLQQCTQ